jgi:hypothetical protein
MVKHEAGSNTCFILVSCLAYVFDPEVGGDMLLRNVGRLSTDYTALEDRALRD